MTERGKPSELVPLLDLCIFDDSSHPPVKVVETRQPERKCKNEDEEDEEHLQHVVHHEAQRQLNRSQNLNAQETLSDELRHATEKSAKKL